MKKVLELDKKTKVIPFTSDIMDKNIFKKNIELTKVFLKDIFFVYNIHISMDI